jgi:hypothetical protein
MLEWLLQPTIDNIGHGVILGSFAGIAASYRAGKRNIIPAVLTLALGKEILDGDYNNDAWRDIIYGIVGSVLGYKLGLDSRFKQTSPKPIGYRGGFAGERSPSNIVKDLKYQKILAETEARLNNYKMKETHLSD